MSVNWLSGNPLKSEKRRRYYIEQFDVYWSLTRDQLKKLFEAGAREQEWDLDDLGSRVRKPAFRAGRPTPLVFRVLDWSQPQYLEAIQAWHTGDEGEGSLEDVSSWVWGA